MKIQQAFWTVGIAATTLTACDKKSQSAQSDTTAMRRDTTMMSSGATTAMASSDSVKGDSLHVRSDSNKAAMAPSPMSDANIMYVLDQANAADSSEGSVAATKATDKGVHDFGHTMMTDHHKMRADGQALAKKLNITPAPPVGDKSESNASSALATLNSTPKGAAWDKAYIDMQVSDHQKVLATAQAALGQAQSPELKDLITKATPIIQKHLDRAMALQKKTAAM